MRAIAGRAGTNHYCDPPGGAHAIDLPTAFGPNCHDDAAKASFGECCFVPLGYDGGPKVASSSTATNHRPLTKRYRPFTGTSSPLSCPRAPPTLW